MRKENRPIEKKERKIRIDCGNDTPISPQQNSAHIR